MANNEDSLFEISKELIDFLRKLLEQAVPVDTSYSDSESPIVWEEVIDNLNDILSHYKNNKDAVGLAEVQVSLSKYLDYYSTGWMSLDQREILNQHVSKIVSLALGKIIFPKGGPYQPCRLHEDRACVIGPLGNRFIPSGDRIVKNWPIMPAKNAANFEFEPDIKTLGKGDRLYRVVGSKNDHYGSWWFLGDLPNNKMEWRSDFAVLTSWNTDDYYVDFILNESLKVWVGTSASVRVPKQNCILKGGGKQIWLDPSDLKLMNIILKQPKKTPW